MADCASDHGSMQMAYVFPRLDERCYVNAAGFYYPGVVAFVEVVGQ